MHMTKNSKVLSKASETVLCCSSFMGILHSVVAYERTYNDTYDIPFAQAKVSDICRDLQTSDFIPKASVSTYDRYIVVARLCLSCGALLPFVTELNWRVALTGNRPSTSIGLFHHYHLQPFPLPPFELPSCVE